jgi:hypothetical protein
MRNALLDCAIVKLSGGFSCLLEKSIIPHYTFKNGVKQLDTHSETPPKITFRLNMIINKVASH